MNWPVFYHFTLSGRSLLAIGKRILFVDDEKSLALLGVDLLEEFGHTVSCAFNGAEALELFEQAESGFDLVVTDETMPGMSGIELAQQIYKSSPAVPVILCSGHLLTMQEAGMETTNIAAVLAKTAVCTQLPELIDNLFAASEGDS